MKSSEILVDWKKMGGLLPVVVQDANSKAVLMLAYMNEEALNLSLSTKFAHYFSRSKNRIWKKGEESGNLQIIKSVFLDCDNDTLLINIEQIGETACHTGETSCFFNQISLNTAREFSETSNLQPNLDAKKSNKYGILDEIYHTCLSRKFSLDTANSYVAKLYKKGENSYLKKLSEEACEFALACKDLSKFEKYSDLEREKFGEHRANEPKFDTIYEGADVLFHLIVALADHSIHPETLLDELKHREGMSGIAEKDSRKG